MKHPGKLILLLTVMTMLCVPSCAMAKKYNLTAQSAFPRGDLAVPLMQVITDTLAAETGDTDKINMQWFGAPEIVPPEQLMDAVSIGTIDILHAVGAYWAGVMPVGDVEFALPMAYNISWKETYVEKAQALREFFFSTGYYDIIKTEYAKHSIEYIDFITAPMIILSVKPLRSLDDFKGVKIRADGLNVEYYNMAGMLATTSVPGTETYLALKLGTIAAAEWDISSITTLNWYEAAPYWVQGIDTLIVTSWGINKKLYDGMSGSQKAAFKKAGQTYWDAGIIMYASEIEKADDLIAAGKLHKVTPDGAAIAIFHNEAVNLWDKAASKDEASKKAVDLLKAWIAEGEASMK